MTLCRLMLGRLMLCRLIIAAFLLLLAGCGYEPPPLTPLASNAVILSFGDSLTHGTGVKRPAAYPAQLSQLSARKVINAGVAGEISSQGLARLPGLLNQHHPALVILCLGGNDMLRKLDLTQTVANLRAMVGLARDAGAQVLMLGVPKPVLFGGTADFYVPLAEELQIPIEADVISDVLHDNALKSDPIHPNAAGYRVISERIYALLVTAGAL